MTFLANHLWQSTWFAVAIGLLTLAFRGNRAAVRYGMWLAASLKFLLPLSLLVTAAAHIAATRQAPVLERLPVLPAITQISQPFVLSVGSDAPAPSPLPAVLLGIWLCGFTINLCRWWRAWSRVRAAVQKARLLPLDAPIPVMAVADRLEPGIFGIRRPMLLLPEGLLESLAPPQLEAILIHELCHVRRRDNLAAAVHMLVEALFWFHPLVWWIGTRLMDERERACDEEVLRRCADRDAYADGILRVCRSYVEPPLACMSGVDGADLTRRIEAILTHRPTYRLNAAKKALLVASALGCAAIPVIIGRAQPESPTPQRFAVVSVKPDSTPPPFRVGMEIQPDGRVHAPSMPLAFLVADAYDLPMNSKRLIGLPDWSINERFTVDAAPEPGAIPPGLTTKALHARVRPMLQAMLADRFKLVIHPETSELPVYALTVRKSGPKLEGANLEEQDCIADKHIDCHNLRVATNGVRGSAVTMDDVAQVVSNWTDRPVINRTGLTGLYKFETQGWGPILFGLAGMPSATSPAEEGLDPNAPTIVSVFSRLGLNLEPTKAPIDTYVIEHVERPSAN